MKRGVVDAEGVTRFEARHTHAPLALRRFAAPAAALAGWRTVLARLGLIGQDPRRYGGAGYGNVSSRVGPYPGERGARAFLVSGTQTGGAPCATLDDFAWVRRYDIAHNRVDSEGAVPPSSESMTHGAIYDLGGHIRHAFHVHSPAIWHAAPALGLPMSDAAVAYGTVAMAREIERLARQTALLDRRLLAMGGHEDGVIAFGRTAADAGAALVLALAAAEARVFAGQGRVCR